MEKRKGVLVPSMGGKGKGSKRKKNQSQEPHGFFAYPNHDKSQVEVIERAITQVNKDPQCKLHLSSWRNLRGTSSRIISNILGHIDRADYLLADLSGLNPNVLFEAGYAFGRRKRLILVIQGNSEQDRHSDLNKIEMLSGMLIHPVENVQDLVRVIRDYGPRGGFGEPEFDMYYRVGLKEPTEPNGLFLKGVTNHQIAIAALATFRTVFPRVVTDDWSEHPSQQLSWYLQAVVQSQGIVALFVNPSWTSAQEVNARFSFVCGLAVALGKTVQMIGLPGYTSPFDYKEILRIADSSAAATQIIEQCFSTAAGKADKTRELLLPPRAERVRAGQSPTKRDEDREIILLDIVIGSIHNTIAENEVDDLGDYFVDTAQFQEALLGRQTLFVGVKGSGKTANFFELRDRLSQDRRNLVCTIKPDDYKMGRFLEALQRVVDRYGAAGHIAETAWKLIVYCELVNPLYERITSKPLWVGRSDSEETLIRLWEGHRQIVTLPFERKLEMVGKWLEDVEFQDDHFSEFVHDQFISKMIPVLKLQLAERHRVAIIVDNLDKAWDRGQDLGLQAWMVLALMGIGRHIEHEIDNVAKVDLVLFLRRNIFEEIVLRYARERDKLLSQAVELTWDDPRMLLQVIEKRVSVACERNDIKPVDVWSHLFPPQVEGVPVQGWLFRSILPRPRDLISFVSKAMEIAINRGHSEIQKEDLLSAVPSYSAFAVNQIIAEYQTESPWISSVIASLAGLSPVWTLGKLEKHIQGVIDGLAADIGAREAITHLVDAGFFGVRLQEHETRYATTVENGLILQEKLTSHPRGMPLELVIHPVFHRHLGVGSPTAAGRSPVLGKRLGLLLQAITHRRSLIRYKRPPLDKVPSS